MWALCLLTLITLLGLCGFALSNVKPIFDTPRGYGEKKIAQTYEPNPKPYGKKEITPEVVEKAEFEVLY